MHNKCVLLVHSLWSSSQGRLFGITTWPSGQFNLPLRLVFYKLLSAAERKWPVCRDSSINTLHLLSRWTMTIWKTFCVRFKEKIGVILMVFFLLNTLCRYCLHGTVLDCCNFHGWKNWKNSQTIFLFCLLSSYFYFAYTVYAYVFLYAAC